MLREILQNYFYWEQKHLEYINFCSHWRSAVGWHRLEMAALNPKITKHLIPIVSDWKSTDWIIANCLIQEQFLVNSKRPIQDARMHAMLCYRTPESLKNRFQRSTK